MNESLDQIRNRIDELMSQKEQVIVAIDGNCTAGKTTLAGNLSEIYDCNDYFNIRRPASALGYKSPVQYKTELGF